jgi:hypothetical protein
MRKYWHLQSAFSVGYEQAQLYIHEVLPLLDQLAFFGLTRIHRVVVLTMQFVPVEVDYHLGGVRVHVFVVVVLFVIFIGNIVVVSLHLLG